MRSRRFTRILAGYLLAVLVAGVLVALSSADKTPLPDAAESTPGHPGQDAANDSGFEGETGNPVIPDVADADDGAGHPIVIRGPMTDPDRAIIRDLGLMSANLGFGAVVDALQSGRIDYRSLSPAGRRKLALVCRVPATAEQLDTLMSDGIIEVPQRDAFPSMIKRVRDFAPGGGEDMIIAKMEVLQRHGYRLSQETKLSFEGEEILRYNAFDKAANFGLPKVLEYLSLRGVQPVSKERIWQTLLKSRNGRPLETARLLIQLGPFNTK